MTKLNSSILSYPSRGKYGDSKYRGNCSGFVIRDLIDTFKPKKFVQVFSGGGTGKDVAREKGYANSIHLDLNNGWDAMTDAMPTSSDFVFSHPPYFDIIDYTRIIHTRFNIGIPHNFGPILVLLWRSQTKMYCFC